MEIKILGEVTENYDYKKSKEIEIETDKKDLTHYTSFDSLIKILENMTLKATNLNNLDDENESKRKGIEEEAKGEFVICFTNKEENNYFWEKYGGDIKEEKIAIKFFDLPININNYIDREYALSPDRR